MENYKSFKLLILILVLFNTSLFSQTTNFQDIATAFRNADSRHIYEKCEGVVNLSIPDVNGKFSKAQTRQILVRFFEKQPAVTVKTLKTESNPKGNTYSIINYQSQNKSYNIFIQFKKTQNTFLIQTIQIQEISS